MNNFNPFRDIEMKFLVVKWEDIGKHLSLEQQVQLQDLLKDIQYGRMREGKKDNTYLVVNIDETYAAHVAEIMKAHGHWGKREFRMEYLGEPYEE
jgi:hypothetical protein